MQIHRVTDRLPDLEPGLLYGLDCETTTGGVWNPGFRVRLLQLATPDEAWVFNMSDSKQVDFCRAFLNDDRNSFSSHTDYDVLCMIVGLGCEDHLAYRNVDTRMLGTMASPEDRLGMNDLDTLSQKYLGPEFTKDSKALKSRFLELWEEKHPGQRPTKEDLTDVWNWIPEEDPVFVRYAGKDAIATRRLVDVLVPLTGAPSTLLRMEVWLCAQAALMRLRGMRVDYEKYIDLYASAKKECDDNEEAFGELVQESYTRGRGAAKQTLWKPISPRSGRKVALYLYGHGADFVGFPMTDGGMKAAKAGTLTLEEETWGKYASLGKENKVLVSAMDLDLEGQAACEALFGFKEQLYNKTKLEEIAKVIDTSNTVHPSLRTLGTVTGRMSSSGPNTQNYSKKQVEMREIYVPREGYILIGCDFAQLEIRVAAALSGCDVLTSSVHGGKSMHEITMEALNVDKPMAKIINFTLQYNGGPKALYEQSGIPIPQGKKMVQTFWKTYKGLAKYRDWSMGFDKEIRTVANRKIPVPQFNGQPAVYKNLNYFLQSAARELCVAAWYRYVNTPGTENGFVWAVIHDEVVAEVPVHELDFHLKALTNSMCFDFMGVSIRGEAEILADRDGKSCWTTGDAAADYAEYRADNGIELVL